MYDTHCHILPGIDDGPEALFQSIQMAERAREQGITDILATPHYNQRYSPSKQEILQRVASFQEKLLHRGISIKLHAGQEIQISGSLLQLLKNDELQCFGRNNAFLLIEFPTNQIPIYTEQIFFELLALEKIPIIVHPERNRSFREDPNRLIPFLDMGCLAQVTAPSYLGKFGQPVQKAAKLMIKHRLVQLMASDAHGPIKRGINLQKAYTKLEQQFGKDSLHFFQDNAKRLLTNDSLFKDGYEPILKNRFLINLF